MLLKNRIDGFDGNSSSTLGHRKHVDDTDSVLVHKSPQHQAHDLHRYSGPSVLEHLQKRQRRDVHGLTPVHKGSLSSSPGSSSPSHLKRHSFFFLFSNPVFRSRP